MTSSTGMRSSGSLGPQAKEGGKKPLSISCKRVQKAHSRPSKGMRDGVSGEPKNKVPIFWYFMGGGGPVGSQSFDLPWLMTSSTRSVAELRCGSGGGGFPPPPRNSWIARVQLVIRTVFTRTELKERNRTAPNRTWGIFRKNRSYIPDAGWAERARRGFPKSV